MDVYVRIIHKRSQDESKGDPIGVGSLGTRRFATLNHQDETAWSWFQKSGKRCFMSLKEEVVQTSRGQGIQRYRVGSHRPHQTTFTGVLF